MKKVTMLLCFLMLLPLLSLFWNPAFSQKTLSIEIQEQFVFREENVFITIKSSYTENITVEIYTPQDNLWLNETDWQANETRDYRVPSFAPFGNYTVKAIIPTLEVYSWFVVREPETRLELVCDQPYYYVKGDTMQIKAFSNEEVLVTLQMFWNWKSFSENDLIYSNTKTANATWNLPSQNQRAGFYKIVANTSETTVTTWRTLLHFTDYTPSSLPFSYEWQGINYTLQGRTIRAERDYPYDYIELTYPKIPWDYRARFFVNNMTFLIRLDNEAQGWAVDVLYALVGGSIKWTINGTLQNPVSFDFQLSHNPLKAWKKRLERFSSANIVFDWDDLKKAKKAFSWNETTKTLHVEIPESFSIDPSIFSHGFEGATDIPPWTDTETTAGETIDDDYTTDQHCGSESCQATADGDAVWEKANIYKDFTSSYKTFYARCYAKFVTVTDYDGRYEFAIQVDNITNGYLIRGGVQYNSPVYQWLMGYKMTGTGKVELNTTLGFSTGTWNCIEIAGFADATAGWAKMWVNGSLTCDTGEMSAMDNRGNADRFRVGIAESNEPDSAIEHLVDCAVFDTSYIGEEAVGVTLPWYNGFEEGDFSAWSGIEEGGGANCTVVGTPVNNGSYAMESSDVNDDGDEAWSWREFDETYLDVYVRAFARINISLTGSYTDIGVVIKPSYLYTLSNVIYNGSSNKWGINIYNATEWIYLWEFGTTSFPADKWQEIEMRTTIHDTNGIAELWINGSLKISQSGLDTNTSNRRSIAVIAAGHYLNYVDDGNPFSLYTDDVKADTERIGAAVYSFTFWQTINVTSQANIWRALWMSQTESLLISSELAAFRSLFELLSETISVNSDLAALRALVRLFSEVVFATSDVEITTEMLLLEMEFTRVEYINGSVSVYVWRELYFPSSESVTVTDIVNIWRALWFQNLDAVALSESSDIWRELWLLYLEQVAVAEDSQFWREMIVAFLEFYETAAVESLENSWREMFMPPFTESVDFSDVINAWGSYWFAASEAIEASEVHPVWRALMFVPSQVVNVAEDHEMLSERILAFVAFFESVVISSQAFFITIPIVVEFVLPIIDIIIVFITAWFFTTGHIFKNKDTLIFGIIAFAAWLIVGFLWLFIQPLSYAVALLFFGISILILITVLIGFLNNLREERMKGRQLD